MTSGLGEASPDFAELCRNNTLLQESDFDETGALVIEPDCLGCPIASAVDDIYTSGDPKWFDLNIYAYSARLMVESIYRDCPGRTVNFVPKWKKVARRILNTEPLHDITLRMETAGKTPGTFYPCGPDKDTPKPEIS